MDTKRQHKIARLLQKDLGDIFLKYARQTSGVLITVTGTRVSPDLSIVHVYLSIFPADKIQKIFTQIQEEKKEIRYELGNRTRHQLRIIPELIFHIDDSLDYAENIDKLLAQS